MTGSERAELPQRLDEWGPLERLHAALRRQLPHVGAVRTADGIQITRNGTIRHVVWHPGTGQFRWLDRGGDPLAGLVTEAVTAIAAALDLPVGSVLAPAPTEMPFRAVSHGQPMC